MGRNFFSSERWIGQKKERHFPNSMLRKPRFYAPIMAYFHIKLNDLSRLRNDLSISLRKLWRNNLFIRQGVDAGEVAEFEEFEGGASPCREVGKAA